MHLRHATWKGVTPSAFPTNENIMLAKGITGFRLARSRRNVRRLASHLLQGTKSSFPDFIPGRAVRYRWPGLLYRA